jgi:hypothetical protein
MSPKLTFASLAGTALLAGAALAAQPVALVEDVTGNGVPVGLMDYLNEGQTIQLPAGAVLTVGYFKSCARETITGAKMVKIGADKSAVEGGNVQREKVQCDGGKMLLSADQASHSGVVAFRGGVISGQTLPEPKFTLFGASPVFEVRKDEPLTIHRLDRTANEIELGANDQVRGRYYDLAKAGVHLEPGGLYEATTGDRSIVFKVDAKARPGSGALIARLVRL